MAPFCGQFIPVVGMFRPRQFSSRVSGAGRNVLGAAVFVMRVSRSFRMIRGIFQALDRGGFERLVGIG